MLENLDKLEEHPNFYVRTQEDLLLAPESKINSGETFERVIYKYFIIIFLTLFQIKMITVM